MLARVMILATVFLACLPSRSAHGQHDPQRNATRHIAAGRFAKAIQELNKADAGAAETHFVSLLAALRQGKTDAAVEQARAALKRGLPFGRLIAGPRDLMKPLYATSEYQRWLKNHAKLRVIHGPMLGNVTDRGASFWLRTRDASTIVVQAIEVDGVHKHSSRPVKTNAATDFTAVVRVDGLSGDTTYSYKLLIDGEAADDKPAGSFRTSPVQHRPARFRVAFGGGAGYVPKWERMWDTILKRQPHAMLMLGDNVYIDDPKTSLTASYCYNRRQSRPEWRRLVSRTAMYAIYDDHDFGTNDCVPGPEIERPRWKRRVWETFRQNWCNPYYGGGRKQPGCWFDFYIGDVHFILLDGRYYRTRKPQPSMLGAAQKKWLFETLKKSRGTFKVLASPVPWTIGIKPGSKDPWDGFPDEREEVFGFIEKNRIDGVFLISADRHRTDLRITSREKGYDLYEFESSKLTNKHTHRVVKTDGLVWGHNKTCSFALMSFDTHAADPRIRFDAITIDGKRVHTHELRLSRLKHR